MAKKVYAVRKGRATGIFETWAECQRQVTGFSGAEFKSFSSWEEAENFMSGQTAFSGKAQEGVFVQEAQNGAAVAYVDGSFDTLTQRFSYGMVFLWEGRELKFHQSFCDEELAGMHNVAGEIKGAEAAMRYAVQEGISGLVIYHDYEGIAKWCTGAWRTNREGTRAYKAYYESICDRLDISFVKVKGHSNDKYNDMADALAKQALGLEEKCYKTEAFSIE